MSSQPLPTGRYIVRSALDGKIIGQYMPAEKEAMPKLLYALEENPKQIEDDRLHWTVEFNSNLLGYELHSYNAMVDAPDSFVQAFIDDHTVDGPAVWHLKAHGNDLYSVHNPYGDAWVVMSQGAHKEGLVISMESIDENKPSKNALFKFTRVNT